MGEDQEEEDIEGANEEEAKESPTLVEPKKRKAKAQPLARIDQIIKSSQPNPTAPITRAKTCAKTKKDREKKNKKKQGG